MKKISIGIVALIIAASIQGCKNKPANNAALNTVWETLNGIDKGSATTMINSFYNLVIKNKAYANSVSACYNITQIREISNLLDKEKGRADGVRLYFGIDERPGTQPQNKIKILMVSTQSRAKVNNSTHGDYYDHDISLLNPGEFGIAGNDPDLAVTQGASLYDIPFTTNSNCNKSGSHYIDFPTAKKWAMERREKSTTNDPNIPITTSGEWFDYCFIQGLFKAIIDNNLSGLRIYQGRGDTGVKTGGAEQDVFILVPTQSQKDKQGNSIDVDYYQCLEDLGAKFKCETALKIPNIFNRKVPLLEQKKQHLANIKTYDSKGYFFIAYDNGELCPLSCN